ncbi:MAG TPA: uroporphyrinogen-III C-methyltransferase [Nitrososphaeraceae archaeon]|jgi:uroporphyrin-III C-methyltransferase|nr:uroporphyrinogen-III C-methyltransferase [Nitrososphaeraceae archaeon]
MRSGKVFICGAGPGDPNLITLKARELLNSCDVVLYDRLICKEIIDQIPARCEKIYVGRSIGDLTTHQDTTNNLMVEEAKKGKRVLRLKGGDPFIFGRGGEEAEYLFERNIEFEIIPGVTSAIGSAAYAGIPLTDRRFASSVSFVSGHEDPEKNEPVVKWDKLADTAGTLVILMGLERLESISSNLITAGMSKDTSVAIIENGTSRKQRVIVGTLSNIIEKVKDAKTKPPAIIIVGNVVSLHEKLHWFNK